MINKLNSGLFLVVISLILSACQSQHDSMFRHQSAELEIGDSFSKDVYSLNGRNFTAKTISLRKVVEKQTKRLSEDSLTSFWKVIRDEKVDKWSAGYLMPVKSERTALTYWVIKLCLNQTAIVTSGGGAFPGDEKFLTPVGPDPGKRFERVAAAFKELKNKD